MSRKRTEIGRLPDFLGIGVQKAGTTWLHDNLAVHPDVGVAAEKELNFFKRGMRKGGTFQEYAEAFSAVRDKLVIGEITPAYSTLKKGRIARIRKRMPDVRLILLLRHPTDRVWSHLRMSHRNGNVDLNGPKQPIMDRINCPAVTSRTMYLETIQNWLSIFPSDQLCIQYYDEIVEEPESVLNTVAKHLGITELDHWPKAKIISNKGQKEHIPEWILDYVNELYREDVRTLVDAWGAPESWLDRSCKREKQTI